MNTYQFIEERDLVQHQIVAALAERQSSHPRVRFKGGTLLRACWADEYRFSEDLDFDWILSPETSNKENIRAFFHGVSKSVGNRFGTQCEVRWGAHNMLIEWAHKDIGSGRIKIDVNRRALDGPQPETASWPLVNRYPKVRCAQGILGYSLDAIASEKLKCISSPKRAKSRDYYDSCRLIASGETNPVFFISTFLQQSENEVEWPTGESMVTKMFEDTLASLDELRQDYGTSRSTGLIIDGPHDFDELVDDWHDKMSEASNAFDAMVESERVTAEQESLQESARQAAEQRGQSDSRPRCGKKLPVANGICTLPAKHSGHCRRRRL